MDNFLSFIKEFRIPKRKELFDASASFPKKSFSLFAVACTAAFISLAVILGMINNAFLVEVPAKGGTIIEGIVGMPTLVNPVLALSDADKDVSAIVYSGLTRKQPDGTFIPDLAESYSVSPNGITYTFILRKDAIFHDGTPVTADDIVFTIEKIKDPLIKSPRKFGWDGVTIEKKDEYTVVFTLQQAYISFMDNTTIGILPSHIWKNVSEAEFSLSGLNIKATGSGPYQIKKVTKTSDGIPQKYELERFSDFTLGEPHIKNIVIISYANEKDLVKALLARSIDQASSISPENAKSIENAGYIIRTATLPRIFGLFFNSTNNKIFTDSAVVHAFDKVLNREEIVAEVLGGYGSPIHNPIPATIMTSTEKALFTETSLQEASDTLEKAGWKKGTDGIRQKGGVSTVTQTRKVGKKTIKENIKVNNGPITKLSFTITTGDTPELKETTLLIKQTLEKIGANVDVKVYGAGELNSLIRSRDYESLFFGQIVNHESDLFSFWHSSQRSDPGLNIALYNNKKVDTVLESAQKMLDLKNRLASYTTFVNEFNKDLPALLIYSPKYVYATSPSLHNLSLDAITTPSDRFGSIHTWYADTDHVWKIFIR